jgi:uncharacterized protein YndB with AHSA1/START domain
MFRLRATYRLLLNVKADIRRATRRLLVNTDRIEKKIVLRAPRQRVWEAISRPEQFGSWFGVVFDSPFEEGKRITGRIYPTTADVEIAKLQKPHEGLAIEWFVERIEPMRIFSFRWHPHAIDPKVDYSKEPATLIVFELEEVPEGTLLTISESGFDQIPLERRARAFAGNERGWEMQTQLIKKYLASQEKG